MPSGRWFHSGSMYYYLCQENNLYVSCPRENVPMEGEKILMSQKQLQRFRVVGLVESGRITLEEAAVKIGVSPWTFGPILCQSSRGSQTTPEWLLEGVSPRPPHRQTSFNGPSGAHPSSPQKSIPCSGG